MKQWISVGFIILMLIITLPHLAGIASNPPSDATAKQEGAALELVYSGNLDGELEPCGCSEQGDLGGIKRRVTTLDNLRQNNPDLVALSAGGLISSDGPTDIIKAEYILKGFEVLAYDAIGVQWRDLAYGQQFGLRPSLPWVSSNWYSPEVNKRIHIERRFQGQTVNMEVFSWLEPEQSPAKQMQAAENVATENLDEIKKLLQNADDAGAVTVLITSLPLDKVQSRLPLRHVDLLFVESAYEVFSEPVKVGKTLVLQAGSRGMRIARLHLQLAQGDISSWQHEVIPMPGTIPDAERMQAWYEAYNEELKQDYLKRAELRKRLKTGAAEYMGEETCKTCHAAQHQRWFDSLHATAYEKLEAVNKAFDPFCIKCHVVGYEQDGGFIDTTMTPHLLGVQCESCHGAGRRHVESAGAQAVPNKNWSKQQICDQCHVQKHSPEFTVEAYWPKVAH
ncbi:MAG: multiheme c-type cytochrome [Gammaproteobacteria bacterium]|nr:multiheme c-type cytochrome [Gammaproteobacteria bacterium]MDH5799741.1 multiheme c-type cytochrome [Gammaproteobacteria bacterium]